MAEHELLCKEIETEIVRYPIADNPILTQAALGPNVSKDLGSVGNSEHRSLACLGLKAKSF